MHINMYLDAIIYFARQIFLCSFRIFKLNDIKVIHDLFSQYLTQILSKTTSFTK
jgi:hypothetical protein